MRRLTRLVAPLAVVVTLSGCVDTPTNTTVPPSSAASTGTPTTPTGAASPNPSPPEDDATVIPVPEAEATSQAAAIAAAEKAVAAFGRPDLPYQQWIDGLYPLMSQAGAAAYEGTDPQNVPVHQITGPGRILEGSTDVALIVEVPTDAGPYNVSLSRSITDAAWLADRIRPAGA
jgi:hypothetical protein